MKIKQGFSAYEEINKQAHAVYSGHDVRVTSLMVGNGYEITIDNQIVFKGNSDGARQFLNDVKR